MNKLPRTLVFAMVGLLALAAQAGAQSWTPLTHQPTFHASTSLLLTDGSVMVHQSDGSVAGSTGNWWRLKPDNTGSYINGTWSQLPSLPFGYTPLFFASAVLSDGRVVVEGGEDNGTATGSGETSMGAIYDPTANSWTAINPPTGWAQIGDAQSAVLPNGTFMLGNCGYNIPPFDCTPQYSEQAFLNASNLTWTTNTLSNGKADQNAEEGWVLLPASPALPSGGLLTVDVWNGMNSEIYNVSTGTWSTAGSTVAQIVNTLCHEVGPSVLRPDGTVFALGGTSNTAIYTPPPFGVMGPGTWRAGPSFQPGSNLGVDDGPAALLPSGNVLVDASPVLPNCFNKPSQFFEFNGTTLASVPAPPNASNDYSFAGRMLVLPTGQVLFTDYSQDVEIYTPTGTFNNVWRPTITTYPSNITIGASWYQITGTQLNGLSQGAMYGDDAQSATNYPLVRITNYTTGHVFYMFTHNHSSMGVATAGVNESTLFDPPLNMERGWSYLVVVANGIPSAPVNINVN